MAVVGALLDARTYAKLSKDDIEKLTAIIDAAIIEDPDIRKKLTATLNKAVPDYVDEIQRR